MNEQAINKAPPGDLHWRYSVPPRTDSKMLLLNLGGVAIIGSWYGAVGEHFLAWCPLPKKQPPTPVSSEIERKAAMFDAIMRNHWLRPSQFYDGVRGWKEKYMERVDAEVARARCRIPQR